MDRRKPCQRPASADVQPAKRAPEISPGRKPWVSGPIAESPSGATQALLLRLELKRRGVDAIAHACRLWAIFEDVSQVGFAATALHLGTRHAEAAIGFGLNAFFVQRLPEAWPAAS